jgi:1-deoxy-D-xylulose-5-phosphate reductoisomerase
LTVLGSTGSIGKSTLKIVRQHPDRFRIIALTAQNNVHELAQQAKEFHAVLAVIADERKLPELKAALSGTSTRCLGGKEALIEAARMDAELVMAAIVGAAGLPPALHAVQRGATLALANKECLVCAGNVFLQEMKRHSSTLIPVDSEHNAIFQIFDFDAPERVENIIITASGGPFRNTARSELMDVTPEQAIKHPNWSMGAKISVDSATLMNKGLEVIEAYYLFPIAKDQIDVIVHPESIIHSMVRYVDGSVLAQMGTPDMCTPIAYALAYPERITTGSSHLDLTKVGNLSFHTLDEDVFPAIRMARAALASEGTSPATLNAANEVAVEAFLKHRIRFTDIVPLIQQVLDALPAQPVSSLDEVVEADTKAREKAQQLIRA